MGSRGRVRDDGCEGGVNLLGFARVFWCWVEA